jgi:PDZ domain
MTSLALVAALLCLPVPQQLVVQDARQLVVVPRADPKLPTDEELARITVAPELVRLARALDADAFADRVAARTAIVARKPMPDELMALLQRKDLGDEARQQLVGILRNRILYAPRGALGIRMENAAQLDGGVRITGLVPGMPAERLFQAGDIVRKVNDVVLRNTADLVNAVQSLPPGVEVKLVVRRIKRDALAAVAPAPIPAGDGVAQAPQPIFEEIEATLRLGSTDELNEKGEPLLGGMGGGNPGVGIIGGGFIGGGIVNTITFERLAASKLAAKRFLPQPTQIPFPARKSAMEARPTATVESVRKLLMELQLADGDADLVRIHRTRLDQLAEQISRTQDPELRVRLQRALEALETEIRGSF